jgi:hypothetical protein
LRLRNPRPEAAAGTDRATRRPIDKALARLVSLKEYKRVAATYSPPLITADAFPPSDNQREVEKRTSTTEGVFLK